MEQDKKVLLLHGSNTSLSSSHDSKPITQFKLSDLNDYDLIISSGPLYSSLDQEYLELNSVLDTCYNRHTYKRIVYMVIREAANLIYSRQKISADQTMVKGMMTYFVREMRHSGISLGIDTQKITSIDIDVRASVDYLYIKSLGFLGLPDELKFLYSFYKPHRLQNMKPSMFVLLTRRGGTGLGWFPYHKWHKRPGEDIMKEIGVEAEHGETLVESKPNYQIGDLQHVKIIDMRLEGYTFAEIAKAQGTSKATPWTHIKDHNTEVQGPHKECGKCKRAKSEHATVMVAKP